MPDSCLCIIHLGLGPFILEVKKIVGPSVNWKVDQNVLNRQTFMDRPDMIVALNLKLISQALPHKDKEAHFKVYSSKSIQIYQRCGIIS